MVRGTLKKLFTWIQCNTVKQTNVLSFFRMIFLQFDALDPLSWEWWYCARNKLGLESFPSSHDTTSAWMSVSRRLLFWNADFRRWATHFTARPCHWGTIFCSDIWRNICMGVNFQCANSQAGRQKPNNKIILHKIWLLFDSQCTVKLYIEVITQRFLLICADNAAYFVLSRVFRSLYTSS